MPRANVADIIRFFVHQNYDSTIQAAPVQNTWYTAIDTEAYPEVYQIEIEVAGVGETLEVRVTRDGVAETMTQIAVAGTRYYARLAGKWGVLELNATDYAFYRSFLYRCTSHKIEFRKTTAAGAGNIEVVVRRSLYRPE